MKPTGEARAENRGRLPARALGATLGLIALAAIVAGSHGRVAGFARADAMVRVAWSARPERVEVCVRVSEEELAKLPAHMRRRVVCEGTTARYHLEVVRDGVVIDTVTVRGGGLRHDREVYVSREMLVAPGPTQLAVRFVRLDSSVAVDDDVRTDTTARTPDSTRIVDRSVREQQELQRRRAQAIPPLLALDTALTLAPRTVLLVTYDETLRRLVAVSRPR